MAKRAEASGNVLSEADAAIVKGMLMRGDRQHDIAACFGVNPGRISDISTGLTFSATTPASPDHLPPKGPYPRPFELMRELESLQKKIDSVAPGIPAQNF